MERVRVRDQHAALADPDLDAATAGGPDAIRPGFGDDERSFPPQGDAAKAGKLPHVAAEQVDGTRRQPTDGPLRPLDLRGEAGRRTEESDREESERREREGGEDGPPRTRPPLAARERGPHREHHRGKGEGQRAHVERGLCVDGSPARDGEHDQEDREGEAAAADAGEEADHRAGF